MVTVNETSRVGLGTQRRRAGTSSATRSVSDRSLAGQCLEPFRRACAALVAGLALCCAGLVGMADAATMAEFALPAMNSNPYGVTTGPDGALWFTEFSANKIGRITTAGVVTEFALPTAGSSPEGITTGPDGALWFAEHDSNKIGRIVPDPVWSATVSLNGSALRTGQTLTYQATLFPGTTPTSVDIYLGVLLPDGLTFLSFIPDPGGTVAFTVGPVPVPYSTGVTLTPLTVPFVYTFSGSEPAGTYFAYATLVAAGTDPLQDANRLALGIQTFEFSP